MVRLIQQPTAGVDLLEQYRQSGSPDIFAQIMRAYGGMVLSVCYKVTKDAADAEDASQAVFLTLAVQCKTGNPIQYLGPWLKKVAKRTALDLVRSRKRRTRRETVTAENRPEHYTVRPGARPEADELNAILRAELDELPGKYKMPLVLHYFGGLSHDAISKEMKCTTAALGVRLHRARKMLGKRLSLRGISLEGMALGAALAAAVPTVFTDRFIDSTHAAIAGITYGPSAALPTGALPDNFASVLMLVQQVGTSMARARLKMATAAFAAGITLLGGAAEAVRCLPESMRPNLDFLAPSQLIKSLLTPSMPTLRLQVTHTLPPTAANPNAADLDIAPSYTAPPVQELTAVNQPVLSLSWPVPMQVMPPAPSASIVIPNLSVAASTPAPRPVAIATMATVAGDDLPPPRAAARVEGFRLTGGGGGGRPSSPAVEPAAPPVQPPVAGHRPPGRAVAAYAPAADAFGPPTRGRKPVRPVAAFEASAVGGATVSHVPTVPADPLGRPGGPLPLPDSDSAMAFVPDSVVLKHGQLFVAGDGRYNWSDPLRGIGLSDTNSADFTLAGVAPGGGLLSVERLPVTTLAAPDRPGGHHFVGIWSLDATFDYDTIRIKAVYDMAFAESLGLPENVLKLWVYDHSAWLRINDSSFERDLAQHALSGRYVGTPQYFAVSAPEPTILGAAGVGAMLLLRRRRRHAA